MCRMRNSTILVIRLRGVATESIKNMVLAGIGTLVVVDGEDVAEEDLGAGFFYRDEDFGKNVRRFYFERMIVNSRLNGDRELMLPGQE